MKTTTCFLLFCSLLPAVKPTKSPSPEDVPPRVVEVAKGRIVSVCTQLPDYSYYSYDGKNGGSNCFHGIILETDLVATVYYGDPVRYRLTVNGASPTSYERAINGLMVLMVKTGNFDPLDLGTVSQSTALFVAEQPPHGKLRLVATRAYSYGESTITTTDSTKPCTRGAPLFTEDGALAGLRVGDQHPAEGFENSIFGYFIAASEITALRNSNRWIPLPAPTLP